MFIKMFARATSVLLRNVNISRHIETVDFKHCCVLTNYNILIHQSLLLYEVYCDFIVYREKRFTWQIKPYNCHKKPVNITGGAEAVFTSGEPGFTPVFSWVHVTRSLVLYVCFVDRCLSFCAFSFGHCVFCLSSVYRFWLPLWYLQTLLMKIGITSVVW